MTAAIDYMVSGIDILDINEEDSIILKVGISNGYNDVHAIWINKASIIFVFIYLC